MSETETAEFETAVRRQVCECTHFGDDHHPDAEDPQCRVVGCDCGEFREQPGPTRTIGITMSVETAIALQVESGLDGRVPEEELHDVAYDIAGRIKKHVLDPVVADLEAEHGRLAQELDQSPSAMFVSGTTHGAATGANADAPQLWSAPSPGPRVWKKGDPLPEDRDLRRLVVEIEKAVLDSQGGSNPDGGADG